MCEHDDPIVGKGSLTPKSPILKEKPFKAVKKIAPSSFCSVWFITMSFTLAAPMGPGILVVRKMSCTRSSRDVLVSKSSAWNNGWHMHV